MVDAVNVLWTSGWDSTYRVADLVLRQGRTVQPWYVLDSDRRSTRTELERMGHIRAALEAKDATVVERLLPLRHQRIEDIPADGAVTDRWRNLASRSHLGGQYDWLARFADAQGVTLELSVHRDDKAHGFIAEAVEPDGEGSYRLRPGTDGDLSIFGRFTFPLLDETKLGMQEAAQVAGFGDVMEMTWFCFVPLLDGKPCGFCPPCRYTREEGLGRRVPAATAWRRAQYLAFSKGNAVRARARAATRRR